MEEIVMIFIIIKFKVAPCKAKFKPLLLSIMIHKQPSVPK
jgi:hypothetical protein